MRKALLSCTGQEGIVNGDKTEIGIDAITKDMDPEERRAVARILRRNSMVSKMLVHDHYRNNSLVPRIKSRLGFLHGKYGFIREIRLYITERRSTADEWERKGALDDGIPEPSKKQDVKVR